MLVDKKDVPELFDVGFIDADVIKYQAGFAAQKTIYHLYYEDGELAGTFQNAKECKDYLKDQEEFLGADISGYTRESEVIAQSEEEAVKACDLLIKQLKKECPCKEYVFYVSGKNNFRDKIATLHQYGGNRQNVAKPVWVNTVVERLKGEYQAKIVDGLEGDDLVSVGLVSRTKKGQLAIHLGIDKDVKYGTPGWHYDWKAKQFIYTSPEEAIRYVYCQAIAGDATDGYYGIPKVGMKKAEKIIADCKTEREMYEAAVEAYRKHFGDLHQYESWDGKQMEKGPEELFIENMNLAFILKEKDVFYKVPEA